MKILLNTLLVITVIILTVKVTCCKEEKFADKYILSISAQAARETQSTQTEVYEVRKQEAHQVDLVCKVNKGRWFTHAKWATITITFNPSLGPPYHGTCVEVDENGLTDRGLIKLTPRGNGFTFLYHDDDKDVIEGTLEPLYY